MRNLTPFEKDVLEMTLNDKNSLFNDLKQQIKFLRVIDYKESGTGFFSTFYSSFETKTPSLDFKFGDVIAEIEGLEFGAGFMIYVEKGLISMLEGYSFEEKWPSQIESYKISYLKKDRKIEEVISSIITLNKN